MEDTILFGNYCRTTEGYIGKSLGMVTKNMISLNDNNMLFITGIKNIKKHSSNIIDLIEVGDYVNGYKVKYVCNEEPCPSGKYVDVDCELDSSESYFFDNEIKSIVTKEEFSNAEYRLED